MSGYEVGTLLPDAEVNTSAGQLKLHKYFDTTCWGVFFCQVCSEHKKTSIIPCK